MHLTTWDDRFRWDFHHFCDWRAKYEILRIVHGVFCNILKFNDQIGANNIIRGLKLKLTIFLVSLESKWWLSLRRRKGLKKREEIKRAIDKSYWSLKAKGPTHSWFTYPPPLANPTPTPTPTPTPPTLRPHPFLCLSNDTCHQMATWPGIFPFLTGAKWQNCKIPNGFSRQKDEDHDWLRYGSVTLHVRLVQFWNFFSSGI